MRATEATSPQTCARGSAAPAKTESSHAPPAPLPLSIESSVSIVFGAAIGPPPAAVALMRPKKPVMRTLPFLIGRNQKRLGIFV